MDARPQDTIEVAAEADSALAAGHHKLHGLVIAFPIWLTCKLTLGFLLIQRYQR